MRGWWLGKARAVPARSRAGSGRTRDVTVAARRRPAFSAVNRGSPSPSRAPVRLGQGDSAKGRTPPPPSRSTDGVPTLDPLPRRADTRSSGGGHGNRYGSSPVRGFGDPGP